MNKKTSFKLRNFVTHILLVLTYFSLGLILSPKLLPKIRSISNRFTSQVKKQTVSKPHQINAVISPYLIATVTPIPCPEAYGSDGKSIYMDKCETRLVLVNNINTSTWQPDLLGDAYDVSLAPNSKNIAIKSRFGSEEDLLNVVLYGSNLTGNLITINAFPFSENYELFWSPSGRYLAYSIQPQIGPYHLAVYDFLKNKNVELFDKNINSDLYGYDPSSLVWSQDEKSFSANLYVTKDFPSSPEGEGTTFYDQSVVMLMD